MLIKAAELLIMSASGAFDFANALRTTRSTVDASYSTCSLRWTQTLFTMPSPNMIISTNEPL